jgi:hypothetical protein
MTITGQQASGLLSGAFSRMPQDEGITNEISGGRVELRDLVKNARATQKHLGRDR